VGRFPVGVPGAELNPTHQAPKAFRLLIPLKQGIRSEHHRPDAMGSGLLVTKKNSLRRLVPWGVICRRPPALGTLWAARSKHGA
jgi:hypothetical protein